MALVGVVTAEESPEGLSGAFARVGDAGRLLKTLVVGVIGVLDGLSMCSAKFLKLADGDEGTSPFRMSFRLGLDDVVLTPVGTEGRENSGFSSSSSIGGKFCANPEISKVVFSWGEDEGEDAGEGGPKEEVGTKV